MKILFFLCIMFFYTKLSIAQIIYTPLNSNVYDFLDRMSAKEIINYYDIVNPIPRSNIADYLLDIQNKSNELSSLELDELKWYEKEYSYELTGTDKRWRLFSYADTLFRVYLTPIVSYSYYSYGGKSNWKRSWLGGFDGTIGKHIGFTFKITDNAEWGDSVDIHKEFTPATGFNFKTVGNQIQYEDINAMLNYSWSWGVFSLGKDYLNWGSGREGQLIFSSKAPSFPFIKLDIHPVKWLYFHYIHGWLASNVPDSLSFYPTTVVSKQGQSVYRENQRSKYIAANLLSIIPIKDLIFSLGNSIIYSDGSVRIPFLIPFIWYYKGIDHNFYASTTNDSYGNNGQVFFNISAWYPKDFHFYSTLFVDEFSLTRFLKGDHSRDQLGYTFGVTNYGSLIDNLLFEIEYTKVMPGVYMNYIQTQTYANNSYILGDWIGQNADELYLGVSYYFHRGLKAKAYFEKLDKGGDQLGTDALDLRDLNFLYLPLDKYNILGFNVNYEPLYDLNISAYFSYTKYSHIDLSNYEFSSNSSSFGISINYGM